MTELAQKRCVPCEGGTPPLDRAQAEAFLKQIDGWSISDDARTLSKNFAFKNFSQALAFANKIGAVAEEENHHPDLHVSWGKLGVALSTHAIHGLSENDFILAAKIDRL